ncbi:o-succinylbenzoate synthase [Plebeiibacterium sediminum]|uniref:O-succinylbenzoate synthase n=1 Tax=Plebeiibacterium sediminum TaxID=2992112 RepID=A0AAE3M7H6_9BACT|nr:o-succinylbenzoate synthase [Plebeiobacterium sediminum]MCW3788584.1 o-succinylbenzoate synthase [Plebeiobacterium sediminum]
MLQAKITPHKFQFITPGGTSRGVLTTKDSWYIQVFEKDKPQIIGIGECSILPKLSFDDRPDYMDKLVEVCDNINEYQLNYQESLIDWPSIRFGIEMALLDLQNGGKHQIFHSDFYTGKRNIPINGLIWMGDIEYMTTQISQKLQEGFNCIKIKIGALDFENEINLIKEIRKVYSVKEIEIRVDANGAFSPDEVIGKMQRLYELDIHSIEQPIKAGQWNEMADICKQSPLSVALDEELIGIHSMAKKAELLSQINPSYIILKPSLLGGFKACEEWIELANKYQVGWWATSALEGNVGLNAIAQWTAIQDTNMPQGLGTGKVFSNNISSPLVVENGHLCYKQNTEWGKLP